MLTKSYFKSHNFRHSLRHCVTFDLKYLFLFSSLFKNKLSFNKRNCFSWCRRFLDSCSRWVYVEVTYKLTIMIPSKLAGLSESPCDVFRSLEVVKGIHLLFLKPFFCTSTSGMVKFSQSFSSMVTPTLLFLALSAVGL